MEESVTIDGDKVWLWLGPPTHHNSTKIDVTMAFNIGLAIGSKNYESIDTKLIKRYS
mgnify:FL=1